VPQFKKNYRLIISTQHFYIFLQFLYTFYELLIKAKQLIQEKVLEDGKGEKEAKLTLICFCVEWPAV
jgi:hypothetical protein